ncbi:zinc ribbon domain-containing protein, partial [Butyricicoccus sp. 1XD8-22]
MVFCTNCGENNEKEAKFCSNCGQPLNHIIQPQTPHNDPSFSTNQEQDVHSFNEENKIQRYEMPEGFDYDDIEKNPYRTDQQPNKQSEVDQQHFASQQPEHFQNSLTPPLQQQGAQRYQPIKKNSNAKVWIISGASVLIVLILAI